MYFVSWKLSDVSEILSLLIFTVLAGSCLACAQEPDLVTDAEVHMPPFDEAVDANFVEHNGGTATGDQILLRGQVLDQEGSPVPDAVVWVRQTDVHGRYLSSAREADELDPHFQYEGWIRLDNEGRFQLKTIVPAAYSGSQSAIPHIHMRAAHGDLRSRYRTLVFRQYPPRNGDTSYLNESTVWRQVLDLKQPSPDALPTAEFTLVLKGIPQP